MKVAETASCFCQDKGCSGIVPRGEKVLEIEFAAPHSEIAKLWGGCSETAYVVALHEGVADDVGAYLCVFLVINGERGTHDAVLEGTVGNVYRLAVEECSLAALCMEEFVGTREIDNTHLHVAVVPESHADSALTYAA